MLGIGYVTIGFRSVLLAEMFTPGYAEARHGFPNQICRCLGLPWC